MFFHRPEIYRKIHSPDDEDIMSPETVDEFQSALMEASRGGFLEDE